MNYYDITVVNMSIRKAKSIAVSLNDFHDCSDGDGREAVVKAALENGSLKADEVQYICEVENLTYQDYQELVEYNRNLFE